MITSRASAAPCGDEVTRLRAVVAAHRLAAVDLPLGPKLEQLLRTAVDVLGARYGALVVTGPDGVPEHVVHTGLDAGAAALLGPLPYDRGPAAAGRDGPGTIRVDDLLADRRAAGLPPQHPAVRALLGAAIRVQDLPCGRLVVGDPRPGRFGDGDEEVLAALAAAAGTAVGTARLAEQARRAGDWLTAVAEVARAARAGADGAAAGTAQRAAPEPAAPDPAAPDPAAPDAAAPDAATLLAVAARAAPADHAALIRPGGGRLEITATDGPLGRLRDAGSSPLARLITAGRSARTDDLSGWLGYGFANLNLYGSAICVPLPGTGRGAVLLVRRRGRAPFRAADLDAAAGLAAQLALALEVADGRANAARLREAERRHRAAQDLHDNVMQRLFATGVGLQSLAGSGQLEAAEAARLGRHIAELDDTIAEIRLRVFAGPGDEPATSRS